jgi:probable rRNA maturation factor
MLLPTGKRTDAYPDNPLLISRQYSRIPVSLSKLRRLALTMYKKEGVSLTHRISLVFCSDRAIRKLNACYRHIDRATDVLSFSLGDADLLGEIYISSQRAKVQAQRFQTTFNDEIIRLFIHGFFHLLGYDHHKPEERIKMEKKEAFYR